MNDPCKDEGSKACTTDGKDALACTLGEMQLVHHCRGPEGCALKDGQLECDMSVARAQGPLRQEDGRRDRLQHRRQRHRDLQGVDSSCSTRSAKLERAARVKRAASNA